MSLAEDLAFQLHEDWRKTRLREDGTYEPRWKKIKDEEFIRNLDKNNLPSYVRLNDEGVWEIDIANARYTQLSGDWQAENKAAAEVVAGIIESGKEYTREEVGEIIHNAWLERNSWAKDDPVLGQPFAKLPKEEQDKDLVQYDTGVKMAQATELDVYAGTLDRAAGFLKEIKSMGGNVYIDFNGQKLYSQFDDVDACYCKVTGKNKEEFELAQKKWHEEYERKEALRKSEAASKVPGWKERGHKLVLDKKQKEWDRCVEIRATDLYHGAELENALQVMEALAAGKPVEEAIAIADSAGHSGASWGMMMNIVTNFSKRGPEFYRATHKEIDEKTEAWLQQLEAENAAETKKADETFGGKD